MIDQSKPPLAELAHYGVKGMKWGVRKGYVDRQNQIAGIKREVAAGTGNRRTRVVNRALSGELLGTKKGAAKRADEVAAHAKRLKTGNAKATDLIRMYNGAVLTDIRRQPAGYGKNANTKFGVKKSYVERQTEAGKAGLRLAGGKGEKGDRLKTGEFLTTRKGQAKRATNRLDHAQRIKSGNATLADKLAMYNNVTLMDLGKQPKNYGKSR